MANHFPIYSLKDKIKDLFEAVVSKQEYLNRFDEGLSRALKFMETDDIVGPSSEISESAGIHSIIIYDNYIQFLWMICCSSLVSYDSIMLLLKEKMTYDEYIEQIRLLRVSNSSYLEGLKMLTKNDKNLMIAQRGKIFELQRAYNNKYYTDKADSMVIIACVYMLQHEYGHFISGHYEDTPYNEVEADNIAIDNLLQWCKNQYYNDKYETTSVVGIVMSLIASAYVNTSLVSPSYPDIDDRICKAIDRCKRNIGHELEYNVYAVILSAIIEWLKFSKIGIGINNYCNNPKDTLCLIRERIKVYKQNYKIV
jgi:hypothetical protein